MKRSGLPGYTWLVPVLALLLSSQMVWAQGLYAPGVGAINRSMGSAAVASPLDGIGAITWNPASLSGMDHSELSFSVELLLADIETASSVPGVGAGVTESDSGAMPIPNVAWTHKTANPRWTIGFGVLTIAGFKSNFPADPTNPIFAPQRSPATFPLGGFGRVYSEAGFIDLAPTVAYAVSDRISIGFSPVATIAKLDVDPLVFAGLNDANGDSIATYPRGQGYRYHWGGGANLGIYYIHNSCWRFGASVKTPRWMENFSYNTEDELGNPAIATLSMDLPLVVSLGTSYTSGERLLVALDVRYVDYENTDGFDASGLDGNGTLQGLGWESVIAVATGLQYRLTDTTAVRLGYLYNDNPIPDLFTQLNIAAPLYYEHTLSCGLSYQPMSCLSLNLSYSYSFQSQISGPITLAPNPPTATPSIPVPGSSVSSTLTSHAIDFGVTVAY